MTVLKGNIFLSRGQNKTFCSIIACPTWSCFVFSVLSSCHFTSFRIYKNLGFSNVIRVEEIPNQSITYNLLPDFWPVYIFKKNLTLIHLDLAKIISSSCPQLKKKIKTVFYRHRKSYFVKTIWTWIKRSLNSTATSKTTKMEEIQEVNYVLVPNILFILWWFVLPVSPFP